MAVSAQLAFATVDVAVLVLTLVALCARQGRAVTKSLSREGECPDLCQQTRDLCVLEALPPANPQTLKTSKAVQVLHPMPVLQSLTVHTQKANLKRMTLVPYGLCQQ